MENKIFEQIFPQGNPLPEQFACYFIGQAYLAPLTQNGALNVPVANVTFEPGCRNNWHSHTGGQLLICTAGRGYYQEQGAPARELRPGDIVEIAPDVVHWHGAAPDSWFSHLAIECNPQSNVNTWLGPVDDAHYAAATAPSAPAAAEGQTTAPTPSRQPLIDLLHAEQCACVIRNGDTIRLCRQRGVKDLFELLKREPGLLAGAFVADKVVGKGAAALLIAGGVEELWADSISEAALELLRTSPVRVAYGASTPRIVNRDGTGICPVEALCSDCRTAAECLPRIEAFLEQMAKK